MLTSGSPQRVCRYSAGYPTAMEPLPKQHNEELPADHKCYAEKHIDAQTYPSSFEL